MFANTRKQVEKASILELQKASEEGESFEIDAFYYKLSSQTYRWLRNFALISLSKP